MRAVALVEEGVGMISRTVGAVGRSGESLERGCHAGHDRASDAQADDEQGYREQRIGRSVSHLGVGQRAERADDDAGWHDDARATFVGEPPGPG